MFRTHAVQVQQNPVATGKVREREIECVCVWRARARKSNQLRIEALEYIYTWLQSLQTGPYFEEFVNKVLIHQYT